MGILADDDSRWLLRVISNGVSSYPVANLDDGVKVRTLDIDVADATTIEAVCSSYNSGISPFEDSVAQPPAGMSKPYLLRLTSACSWGGVGGSASLVVEDGQKNVIFDSATSPSTVFSEAAEESIEEIAYARFVDMGLPSGLLWATCNIDATKPAGMAETEFTYYGSFISWGNTEPHNPVSDSLFEYDFGLANAQAPWYVGQPYGSTPGAALISDITLASDAARVICGEPWRMPTQSEFKELFDNVNFLNADGTVQQAGQTDKCITLNGIVGIWIQSKINGNRLFFACAGVASSSTLWSNKRVGGYYWSASFYSDLSASCLKFSSENVNPQYLISRYGGSPIRPVRDRSSRRRRKN